MNDLVMGLADAFGAAFGSGVRPRVAVAPGRVNLIGEHTDYNDGFVLPMAVDRYVGIAFAPREDGQICAVAPDFRERFCLTLDDLEPGSPGGWMGYVAGVAWAFRSAGLEPRGMDLVIRGQVPIGAGLSSSAALEMAAARAFCEASGVPWEGAKMAVLGQKAEREYVGVACGIMDQFASAMSADGSALLLDCRSLETRLVPIPRAAVVVVMDTGVRRSLAVSEYNERYGRCQDALRAIRQARPEVRALRDVDPATLAELRPGLDSVTYRRALHVVQETLRPVQLAEALARVELQRAGRLMNESHRSLRELYEVSSAELDRIVELGTRHPACYGARLTGAGFGGCAVALVRRDRAGEFMDEVLADYRRSFDHPAELFACEPAAGAHVVDG